MINFFRVIRRRLTSESKFGKYLLYATGEITLVVIGILIALQINNWNDIRKNRQLENEFLIRLHDDLEEEMSYIESFTTYNRRVNDFANQAIEFFENREIAFENSQNALIILYQASQFNDARTTASTYKELNSSGQINLIKNYNLRSSIISYYELDWTNSVIFDIPNNYRVTLRSFMPSMIQKEIRNNCGDVYVQTKKSISVEIPNNCEINIPNEAAKNALSQLLANTKLKEDLNFLIGNMDSKLAYMTYIQQQLQKVKRELNEVKK